jgi:hypothetical protein
MERTDEYLTEFYTKLIPLDKKLIQSFVTAKFLNQFIPKIENFLDRYIIPL